jgi:hypothetical protein
MPITRGYLQALTFEADGTIGAALAAFDFDAEGRAQCFASRTLACNVGTGQIPLERRGAEPRCTVRWYSWVIQAWVARLS